jgi:hypothetical protein
MDNERSLGERLQVLKLMNFMDLIKKSFSDSWTGGASIDPSTGLRGKADRFHGPGAFDNFKMADLFDNDRWTRENRVDTLGNPQFDRGGDKVYTSYYSPRDITETVTISPSGEETKKIVSKLTPDKTKLSFLKPFPLPHERTWDRGNTGYTPPWAKGVFDEEGPGQGSFAPWSDREGRRPLLPSPYPMRGVNAEEGPGMGSFAPWSDRAGQRPPMQGRTPLPNTPPPGWRPPLPNTPPPGLVPRRNPGYPGMQTSQYSMRNPGNPSMNTSQYSMRNPGYPGQQGLPSISPATRQIGTPMLPRGSWDRRARAQEQAIASGQRPYSYNMPQAEPFRSTPTQSRWNPGNMDAKSLFLTPEMKKIMIDMMRQRSFKKGSY